MKVLHVVPSIARGYGGPTRSLGGYARAAAVAGIECAIAAPAAAPTDVQALRETAPEAQLLQFNSSGDAAFVHSASLVEFVRDNARRFDAVHVHGLFNGVSTFAARVCRRAGTPLIVRPFGMLSHYTFGHRRRLLKRFCFAMFDGPNVRAASGIHFTTTAERDEAAWHGIPLGRESFVVAPPYIREAHAPPQRLLSERPTALLVSRLDPVKNIEVLLDAWRIVVGELSTARLVIAGDGPRRYRADLEALASRFGLTASVEFRGFVDGPAKQELYENAHVFVLPSRHENFGIAVLEALAAGVPAVVTAEVQLSEFIAANALGAICAASPSALAADLLRFLGSPAPRLACANRAPALVEQHFGIAAIGAQLLTMYRAAAA